VHIGKSLPCGFLFAWLSLQQGEAQEPLSLKDAVRVALDKNCSLAASNAATNAAETRITQARAGNLPKLNYAESWTRSDNPVFVFSSLLTQHQFGAGNFQLGPLNRPDFLNNFQSQVSADQPLFDGGQTKRAIRSAELSRDLAGEEGRRSRQDVIAGVIRSYYAALLGAAQLRAAALGVRSAQADLERAENVRLAGMSTDVDVLSIRVHLAGVREQQIRRQADLDVATAALNDAVGLPLDTPHALTTTLQALAIPPGMVTEFEQHALRERPEARQVKLATQLAGNQGTAARSAMLPQVGVHAAFEADRQRLFDRGGTNWLVSIGLKWNLFNGFADRARIEESTYTLRRSEAEQSRALSTIRLQVRRAWADLSAAQQRIEVARASVAEAEESVRITQNRYAAGLGNVTELLRTETALLESRTRQLAAVHDQRMAAAMLELAAGTLTENSEILNEGSR
jgi:outer membrane protein